MEALFEYLENKQHNTLNILSLTIQDEDGATMVEYALMVGLIAAVVAAAVNILGTKVHGLYSNAATKFP